MAAHIGLIRKIMRVANEIQCCGDTCGRRESLNGVRHYAQLLAPIIRSGGLDQAALDTVQQFLETVLHALEAYCKQASGSSGAFGANLV
jgi:hypothetical protein